MSIAPDLMNALEALHRFLQTDSPQRQELIHAAYVRNPWFTRENTAKALDAIAEELLDPIRLRIWAEAYPALTADRAQKTVGIVCAGNIPAVGFHDFLCALIAGHRIQLKLSEKDAVLMRGMVEVLWAAAPALIDRVQIVEKLTGFDAVIATGSDNSSLYFHQYFQKYPNIIRKNRNSAAVLFGDESAEDFHRLGTDIFRYFGLGCRSVSKVFVPQGYDFSPLMAALDAFKDIMNHTKYLNNYEYNRSLYLLNNQTHFANDCVMLLESDSPLSRIATVHYEFYRDRADLSVKIQAQLDHLQCVASNKMLDGVEVVPLGGTQTPSLFDYADGIDTMRFLTEGIYTFQAAKN